MTFKASFLRSLWGGGFGFMLASDGIYYDTWKFWALFGYVFIWTTFAHSWGQEDYKNDQRNRTDV